jgi:acyl dehydratase
VPAYGEANLVTGTGLYYEDWEIGHRYETRARTITIADIEHFGEVEGAKSPMHLDPEYAKQTIWGRMTIHGLLTMSVAAGMMGESGLFYGTALAFLNLTWAFHAPAFVGDELRVRWWVSDKKPTSKPSRGIVTRTIEVVNQDDLVVCSGTMATLWSRREDVSPVSG